MSSTKPLLSICIPTFNRAAVIDRTISSIVSQKEFHQELVELVISDNASNDNTEEVVKKYQALYKNISYYKNQKNIEDRNFPVVIDKANGVFRKLCNDNCFFADGTIGLFLELIKNNINEKPIFIFLNANYKKRMNGIYKTHGFNSFLEVVSYWTTWIGGFGIWEDDFNRIDKFAGCEIHLWQVKVTLETLETKKKSIIINNMIFNMIPRPSYPTELNFNNFFDFYYTVFYVNYLNILKSYLERNILSINTWKFLKRDILFGFFLKQRFGYLLVQQNRQVISKLFLRYFHEDEYYVEIFIYLKLVLFKQSVKSCFFLFKMMLLYLKNNGFPKTVIKIFDVYSPYNKE